MKKQRDHKNLWDLRPKRNAEWVTNDAGRTVVLVPKFSNPYLVKWVLPHLAKPYLRVTLDEIGSAIWQRSDGSTTVASIAESLKEQFGQSVEPVDERIGRFLHQLERGDLIVFERT